MCHGIGTHLFERCFGTEKKFYFVVFDVFGEEMKKKMAAKVPSLLLRVREAVNGLKIEQKLKYF